MSLAWFTSSTSDERISWKREKLDEEDPFYFAILESLNRKKEDLAAIDCFARKKKRKQSVLDTIGNEINYCADIRKNKMVIEFNNYKSSSIKSITVIKPIPT